MNDENEFLQDTELCDNEEEIRSGRKHISAIFTGFTLASIIAFGLSFLMVLLAEFVPFFKGNMAVSLAVSELFVFFLMVFFHLFTRKKSVQKLPALDEMTIGIFLKILCMSVFLMVIGSLAGSGVAVLVETLTGYTPYNAVDEIVTGFPLWQMTLVTVVAAPVLEELVFRKLLLGKLSVYGTEFAVVVSGVMFGVFHYSVFQIFYGILLGILLGYVYAIFGKLRYTIVLHAIINFLGSVVALAVQNFMMSENYIYNIIAGLYGNVYLIASIAGVVFLWRFLKVKNLYRVDGVLVSPFRIVAHNFGFWFFAVYSLLMFAISI